MYRLALVLLIASMAPAAAHPGHPDNSLLAGLLHPLMGVDHVLAMLAVGVWSGLVGGHRLWAWPAVFVVAMIAGGLAGYGGLAMPMVEQGVAASLVVTGVLVALLVRAPMMVGIAVVAAFAVFHGHAHGTEAGDASFAAYMAGFVVATAALHVAGIGIALALQRMFDALPVRLIGAGTALAGVVMLAKGA